MSALAWTLRKWRDESWPLFVMMNFTCSRTGTTWRGRRTLSGDPWCVRQSSGDRGPWEARGVRRVISGVRGILPGLGYPGGKTEVVGSSGATSPRRSADVRLLIDIEH